MTSERKEFSREELLQHNGKDQSTVYVGYEGKVYDVSESKLWKTGSHKKRHPHPMTVHFPLVFNLVFPFPTLGQALDDLL